MCNKVHYDEGYRPYPSGPAYKIFIRSGWDSRGISSLKSLYGARTFYRKNDNETLRGKEGEVVSWNKVLANEDMDGFCFFFSKEEALDFFDGNSLPYGRTDFLEHSKWELWEVHVFRGLGMFKSDEMTYREGGDNFVISKGFRLVKKIKGGEKA